jgi:hypothetical protein
MNHDRLQHTFIVGPNFFPDALFRLLKCGKFVLLQFGFQVSQVKAVRRREVRRPGWTGGGTKTLYDAFRKDGSHTVKWYARIVQYRVDVRDTVHLLSSEEWGPMFSKSDTPHQKVTAFLTHSVAAYRSCFGRFVYWHTRKDENWPRQTWRFSARKTTQETLFKKKCVH